MQRPRLRAQSVRAGLTLVLVLGVLGICFSPLALSAAISQGFRSTEDLAPGSLVSRAAGSSDQVEAADTTNGSRLLGVIVNDKSAVLELAKQGDRVQVATTGNTPMFVSNLNGSVNAGDLIGPSPIRGVGMKATETGKVIGAAGSSFDGRNPVKTTQVATTDGKSKTVAIGMVPVNVQVSDFTSPTNKVVPVFLQQAADTVAGHPVPTVRLIIVGVILISAFIVVTVLLFSTVRGAVISIGRNPLAKTRVYRGMFQVVLASFLIMGVAVGGSYFVISR